MKKSNLINIGVKVFGVMAFIMLFAFLHSVMAAGAGIGITMAEMIGAPVVDEALTTGKVKEESPDLDRDFVSKKIVQMRPASVPLDTIMRNISASNNIGSWKSEYYAVDNRPFYDTVKTAYNKAGDGVTSYNLVVNNIQMWNAHDTCLFKGVEGADGGDLACFIISRNVANTTILIQPLNGLAGSGTTAGSLILPTIPVSTRIVRMGAAKQELDAKTSPYSIIPVKEYNYLQRFMAQVEQSTFQKLHNKEVDFNFNDIEAQNIYDMRATTELSMLFSVRSYFYDVSEGKDRYTTGGLARFITKSLTYGTGGSDRTIDNDTFVDWTQSIFTGNSGSDNRVLFGGDGLMAYLMKVNTVQKQIEAKQTEIRFGVTFNRIETNFGVLYFKHHPLLDQAGWGEKGFVLDLNNIEKHNFGPMGARQLDLVKSGEKMVDATVIEETTGLICRYPDTHAIIGPAE